MGNSASMANRCWFIGNVPEGVSAYELQRMISQNLNCRVLSIRVKRRTSRTSHAHVILGEALNISSVPLGWNNLIMETSNKLKYIVFLQRADALQLGVLHKDVFTRIMDFSDYAVETMLTLAPANKLTIWLTHKYEKRKKQKLELKENIKDKLIVS
jgi:hypothetical protein